MKLLTTTTAAAAAAALFTLFTTLAAAQVCPGAEGCTGPGCQLSWVPEEKCSACSCLAVAARAAAPTHPPEPRIGIPAGRM
ncbi:hypothetical protein B0J12DRAFT_786561 [Macrophomina phaseolina]|uniref:Uncharacterized protein n=1 Tax=Macrophomina phaseolina TaxID=35725 RepID=A0ABQ8G831_9PEZI|nr:hypothetical protein B0J12DRAFT_786561 [Macrophomina phaseolina]